MSSEHRDVARVVDWRSGLIGPDGYLKHVQRAKAAVCVTVIAGLNGISADLRRPSRGWRRCR